MKCNKCGEEIQSMLHKCNPFRDIKLDENTVKKKEKQDEK